jgi:hypothetical protein
MEATQAVYHLLTDPIDLLDTACYLFPFSVKMSPDVSFWTVTCNTNWAMKTVVDGGKIRLGNYGTDDFDPKEV